MFNLNTEILKWRQQMMAGGIKSPEVLEELESHLRDDIEQQMRSGATEQEAFEAAINRIGRTTLLKSEFDKVGSKWPLIRKLMTQLKRILGKEQPFPNLHYFNPRGLQVLDFARAEAPLLGHDFVGTEHVLLGLMKLEDGTAQNVLRKLGVDYKAIRVEIERYVGVGQHREERKAIPYTPRAKRALHLAEKEAKTLKHCYVGSEHILLGLLLENEGVAGLILRSLGVRPEATREAILRELAG